MTKKREIQIRLNTLESLLKNEYNEPDERKLKRQIAFEIRQLNVLTKKKQELFDCNLLINIDKKIETINWVKPE